MTEFVSNERILEGLGVAPGIAIGNAYIHESGILHVPEYHVAEAGVAAEQERLAEAVSSARRQLAGIRAKVRRRGKARPEFAGEDFSYLLDAYWLMLRDSRLVRGAHTRIARDRLNAEAAVHSEVNLLVSDFRAMDDPYLAARSDDVREVGNRLIQMLIREPVGPFVGLVPGSVIIADALTPADAAQVDPELVAGLVVQVGGQQSHTAIMARALGLPAVLGVSGLMHSVEAGRQILVDGDSGRVVVNPTRASFDAYTLRRTERDREHEELREVYTRDAVTLDGVAISVQANVELPIELDKVREVGAAGIGLLRTEFLFLNRVSLPGEDEQFALLSNVVERSDGKPITIRTLDLGGDKSFLSLVTEFGDSIVSPLGLRGIRLSLARSELLETQFRAILRVAAHAPVRILLRMVSSAAEVTASRELLLRAAERLQRRGIDLPAEMPPLGIMIEVPGAALAADALAAVSDFFAIGSNDLTMYTLAIDRGDERVAHLYNPLHPAVLRLIQFSAAAANRAGIPVGVCGEIAGDERFTALLIGLGFRTLSMAATRIPKVKRRILNLDAADATVWAHRLMEETDPMRLQTMLDEYNHR